MQRVAFFIIFYTANPSASRPGSVPQFIASRAYSFWRDAPESFGAFEVMVFHFFPFNSADFLTWDATPTLTADWAESTGGNSKIVMNFSGAS